MTVRDETMRAAFDRALDELRWRPARLLVADRFAARLTGLVARGPLDTDGTPLAMGFPACRSVHTCFMRYPLDIACIDERGRVLAVHEGVPPWRLVDCPGAWAVLERASLIDDNAPKEGLLLATTSCGR